MTRLGPVVSVLLFFFASLLRVPPTSATWFVGSAKTKDKFVYVGKYSWGTAPKGTVVGSYQIRVETEDFGGLVWAEWDDTIDFDAIASGEGCGCNCAMKAATRVFPIINNTVIKERVMHWKQTMLIEEWKGKR